MLDTVALAVVLGVVASSALVVGACVPRDRMCAVDDPCGQGLACVTGRCVSPKGAVRLFEVDDAGSPVVKRRVVAATAVGWLAPHSLASEGASEGLPEVIALGGTSHGVLLLRFEGVVVPADLVEAYVLLRRAPGTDPPVSAVTLVAHRIEEAWDPMNVSLARPPRWAESSGPETRVLPVSGEVVRIDVRALVAGWSKRRVNDQGIAITVPNEPLAPLYVALSPTRGAAQPPMLELYVR